MSSYLNRPRSLQQAIQEAEAAQKLQAVVPETFQGLLAGDPLAGIQGRDVRLSDVTGREQGSTSEFVFEMLADPSMIFGPIKTMYKGLGSVAKAPAKTYADVASSLSNYITGYYGSGGSKAGAIVSWLPEQLKNTISHFSPSGLKTLEKTGMSKPIIDMTAKYLAAHKAKDGKALPKLYAQLQHAAYMMHRAGIDTKEMPPMYQRMIKSMSLNNKGFQPFSKEQYVKEASEIVKTTAKGAPTTAQANPSVLGELFDKAQTAWGVSSGKTAQGKPMDMIIRRPDAALGDFASDVSKSLFGSTLANMFKKNQGSFESPEELLAAIHKELRRSTGQAKGMGKVTKVDSVPVKDAVTGKTIKGNPYVVEGFKIGDDGVYFNYRGSQVEKKGGKKVNELASRSYLEGGVNMQVHVTKEGVVTAIISDTYDFLEDKIPQTEKVLERGIWGVSAPIVTDVTKRGDRTAQISNKFPTDVKFGIDEARAIADTPIQQDVLGNVAYGDIGQRMLTPDPQEEQ
jgi:hypothetical protein